MKANDKHELTLSRWRRSLQGLAAAALVLLAACQTAAPPAGAPPAAAVAAAPATSGANPTANPTANVNANATAVGAAGVAAGAPAPAKAIAQGTAPEPVVATARAPASVPSTSVLPAPVLAPSFSPAQLRALLAPTGTLRVAVYPGSPTSMLPATANLPMRGVAVEVGRALAQRLDVPIEIIVLPRVAEVVAALKDGRADMTVTNATPERAKDVDFPFTLLSLELGVLVRPGSPLTSLEHIDAPGLRLGVSQGSSSQREWAPRLSHSSLVAFPTLQSAAVALNAGQLDAFITNKGILFELADSVPGARVLEGRWGLEYLALAVPQGRQAAVWELRRFASAQVASGAVARAAANAGLRGHVVNTMVPAGGNAPVQAVGNTGSAAGNPGVLQK